MGRGGVGNPDDVTAGSNVVDADGIWVPNGKARERQKEIGGEVPAGKARGGLKPHETRLRLGLPSNRISLRTALSPSDWRFPSPFVPSNCSFPCGLPLQAPRGRAGLARGAGDPSPGPALRAEDRGCRRVGVGNSAGGRRRAGGPVGAVCGRAGCIFRDAIRIFQIVRALRPPSAFFYSWNA